MSCLVHARRYKLGQLDRNGWLFRNIQVRTFVVRAEHARVPQGSFDPPTLVMLEAAFDEAWLTLKADRQHDGAARTSWPRSVLRLAMEGERDPVRLHDGALKGLVAGGLARGRLNRRRHPVLAHAVTENRNPFSGTCAENESQKGEADDEGGGRQRPDERIALTNGIDLRNTRRIAIASGPAFPLRWT